MRKAPSVVLLVLVAAFAVLGGAAPAAGHAYLVGSNPADGDRLTGAPPELRLDFSEHVVLAATRIEVRTADGREVAVGDVRLETKDAGDTEEPATIVAALPDLRADAYRVSWETLSSDDLHRTSGLIVFGVGRNVAPAASVTSTTRPEEALLRGALLACIAVALGGLVARRVLLRALTGPSADAAQRVVTRLAVVGASAAPLLAIALFAVQWAASGTGPADLLVGGYGPRAAVRLAGLLVLCAVWWSWRRRSVLPGRAAAVACVLVSVGTGLMGHAPSGGRNLVHVVVASAHVAAALSWAGALVCLAAAMLWGSARRAPDVLATLHAFGPAAGACLGVTVVTGIYLSSDTVVSVDAAVLTTYGRTLILKVLLVAVAGALGLWHHRRVRGPHDLDPPRRTVLAEAGVLLAVVGLAGLLASTATATDPAFARQAPVSVGQVSRQVTDLQLAAGLSPNRRGDALAVVDVFDTRRPAPGPVVGVDVRLGGGPHAAAERLGDGRWSAPVRIDAAGPTTITVTVLRAGMPPTVTDFRWTVPGAHPARGVLISHTPVRPLLRWSAAALAGVLLAGWTIVGRRGRARRPAHAQDLRPPRADELDDRLDDGMTARER
ncbi:copper resistance CopC/CopD family protein [Nocardioides pocheonensis]|uniref:Copper resistance protein CopC n=1 Tax=Nocardioides pocheonensis TaxID=661485 RepID=A0A3N0GUE3_9ACTN|nr:copper resistance protein CopC [Nocardioides pocheonensis]RNM15786.1 hypothetical protein EFL26_06280 [Nocardioides pocheonensis]